jgi:signal transduction histidine kinase
MIKRLLIADDDIRLLEYYRTLFQQEEEAAFFTAPSERSDIQAETFTDGESLLRRFKAEYERQNQIPICILDMRMGGLSGLQTGTALRQIDPHVILIIITAYSDVPASDIRAKLLENIYYFKKPFNAEELYALVHSLLNIWNRQLELRMQKLQLEQEVHQRLQSESRLQQALMVAQESARAKSQFLANMSHEVRTPINGIMGMLELLQGTPISAEQHGFVTAAIQSAEDLLRVFTEILDYSRIGTGSLELVHEPFCLKDLLEAAGQQSADRAREKGLSLRIEVSPDAPNTLVGDASRVSQIIQHLLNNAIKFTRTGGVVLRATCLEQQSTPAIHTVQVEVVDTGIGIAPDQHELIFEAFTQADGSTTRQFGGTGLGLAICRQLAHSMGGSIRVTSQPNQGATFTVVLPFPAAV